MNNKLTNLETSKKTDDMSKDDRSHEFELFVEEITATDVSCIEQEKEIWRTCCYNGEIFEEYQVSSLGRVKSFKGKAPRILKTYTVRSGYYQVDLCKDNKRHRCRLHRLVLCSFTEIPDNWRELEVNHLNQDKSDNRLCNLNWLSHLENIRYGDGIERSAKANTNGKNSKKVYQFTLAGELIATFPSTNEVKRQLGFDNSSISRCCNGIYKTAYSYRWSYSQTLED